MNRPFAYGKRSLDWRPTQLREFLTRRRTTGGYDLPLLSVNLTHGVQLRDLRDSRPAPSEDLSSYQLVEKDDLVMNQLGKPHGSLGVSPYRGIISPAYFVASIGPSVVPRFVHYLLRSRLYISEYERRGKWMPPNQFDISWEQFRSIPVELPPLDKQQIIANYLDDETSRIDALVAKKRRMIDLVNERERGIVARPFPTDIVYSVDGRPIGLKGDRCIRLGGVAKVQTGLTVDEGRDGGLEAVTLPYLRVANVQDGSLNLSEVKEVMVGQALAARCTLRTGDVLMTEGGDPDKLGRGTVWLGEIEPCLHQNHVFAVRPNPNLLPEYLALVTRTPYARAYFEMTASKTTNLASTSVSKIAAFRIPLPDIAKQEEVIKAVRSDLAKIDIFRDQLFKQIGLLRERRQALIIDAVTGELNVPALEVMV